MIRRRKEEPKESAFKKRDQKMNLVYINNKKII